MPTCWGLLEFLETQGGACDLFLVVTSTHVPFDKVLTIVKGLEMLELVDTPKRKVLFTPLGQRFVQGTMNERKQIWRGQLMKMKLFRVVQGLLELNNGHLPKEELIHEIGARLPMENAEHTFHTLVAWGRFGGAFAYHKDKEILTFE